MGRDEELVPKQGGKLSFHSGKHYHFFVLVSLSLSSYKNVGVCILLRSASKFSCEIRPLFSGLSVLFNPLSNAGTFAAALFGFCNQSFSLANGFAAV
jgi:hypothetical protein